MPKMIQVRNVPDDLHKTLKLRAVTEGMSLSDYIKRELGMVAGRSGIEDIDARIRARGPSGVRTKTILKILRESRGE